MSFRHNWYFKVTGERGFQIYRQIGSSASNTYVGASRAFNAVLEAVNARDGEEIHALLGGTFLVGRDGKVHEIMLKPPKPLFERGNRAPDHEIMQRYVKRGLAAEIPQPAKAPDYRSARERAHNTDLGPHHQEIVPIEPSPEFVEMRAAMDAAIHRTGGRAAGWTVRSRDIDAYGGPLFEASRDGTTIRFKGGSPGVYSVEVPETLDVAGPKDPIVADRRKIFHFRDIDGVSDPLKAASDFMAECGEAIAPTRAPRM